MLFQAMLGKQTIGLGTPNATGVLDLGGASAVEVEANCTYAPQIQLAPSIAQRQFAKSTTPGNTASSLVELALIRERRVT